MAKFDIKLPDDTIKALRELEKDCGKIFEEMTRAGAEVALENIEHNAPASFRDSEIRNCLGIRETRHTGEAISTRVDYDGYFTNENGQREKAALVAGVFEFGKPNFQKQPFIRRSFRKSQMEEKMLKKQEELMKKYET